MGRMHSKTIHDTAVLAGKLGVKTIVMMSGLPEGAPGEHTPNWLTSTISWPEYNGVNYMVEAMKYQWEVAGKWWKEFCAFAKKQGVEKIAIEEFPGALVHNVRTFNKLCEAVGADSDVLGLNLDPSHLMIQGADPIAAARALGEKIFYVHGKDARIERGLADVDGLLERPYLELCRGRLRQRPPVVEGIFLGVPYDGLQRLCFAGNGGSHHVGRSRP